MNQKTLVVYYSRTGTTGKVAEYIRDRLAADIEEIHDKKNRRGPIGWLMAGRDAGNKSLTVIETPSKEPSGYDLVVIGTPVWNDTVSSPIRTYITEYEQRFNQVALFSTQDSEEANAVPDMEAILGRAPIASIQLQRKQDVESGDYKVKLTGYLEKLTEPIQLENQDTKSHTEAA